MLIHTATTAKPEIADSATNTVSGATTLELRQNLTKPELKAEK
jgi:hypothetical protein